MEDCAKLAFKQIQIISILWKNFDAVMNISYKVFVSIVTYIKLWGWKRSNEIDPKFSWISRISIVTLADRLHCETTDVQLRFCCHNWIILSHAFENIFWNSQGYQLRQIVAEMFYPADWEHKRRMNSVQGCPIWQDRQRKIRFHNWWLVFVNTR